MGGIEMTKKLTTKKGFFTILVCLMVLMFGTSCARITEEQKNTANRITENLFEGIRQEDYSVFSKDFNSDMLSAMDETAFKELAKTIREEFGSDFEIQWVSAQKTTVKGKAFGVHHYKITSTLTSEPADFTLFASEDGNQTFVSGFSMDSIEAE